MAPWRVVGAVALIATFALMGWQVQRLVDDHPWSNPLMWGSVVTAAAAVLCVLVWTWITTDNAKRLVEPAVRQQLPDPMSAVLTWIAPLAFAAVAIGVASLWAARTAQNDGTDVTVSTAPISVAVVALLLAVPMTYRPLNHLAAVIRHVGGYSVRLAKWMWVPVVTGVVGVGSLVALRFAGVDDTEATSSNTQLDVLGTTPLWVVAVAAIGPCVVVVLLAWRAGSSVEDALRIASIRRRRGQLKPGEARTLGGTATQRRVVNRDRTRRIDLLPGDDLLRLVTVALLAGTALLSIVGAVVTGLLWLDSRNTGVLPAERQRTLDTLDALGTATGAVVIALVVAVTAWTFVVVLNVRKTSGRRRNPLIAALAWPASAAAVWWIADRVIADASISMVMLGFAAQAGALLVPIMLLDRSAAAIGARRTPLRIVYVLAVLMLVHVQGLGGLSRLPDSVTITEIGRLAGYLAIGALIQLCSTVAVTDVCSAMSLACRNEADHHNMLVDQHEAAARRMEQAASR